MTQKIAFSGPFDKPRQRRRGRRILFHFILFTLLGVALLALGVTGAVQLHKITDERIAAQRTDMLISQTTTLVKTTAESLASNTLRSRISNGLSTKTRSVRAEASSMLSEGAEERAVAEHIISILSEAAVSKLSDDNEDQAALKTAVSQTLAEQHDSMVAAVLEETASHIDSLSTNDVRKGLTRGSKNYFTMFYSPLMLIVGALCLVFGIFMGVTQFCSGADFAKKVNDIIEPLDYLMPFFFGVIVFTLYPMVRVFIMAFQERYKLTGEFAGWGLGNFRDVLYGVNTKLPQAVGNTFLYVLLTVPISTAISIVLAYLLNQKIKLRALFQTAYFLPMVTSATAVGLVWKFMFHENYGIINWLLSLVDVSKISWLNDAAYSMAVMVIYGIWDSLPFTIILMLSGLQNIDDSYYTVAKVDGARAKRIFFRITVPLLSPTIGLVLIINSISAFKVFNSVIILFSGYPGPMYNMYTMTYYIYEQINTSLEYGRAAAASLILFVFIFLFTMLQRFVQRKWKYD